MKRAHWLQHVPFEGLGSIGPWLDAAGYLTTATRFFESADLPSARDVDLLVVMGGPMSVNDEAALPWLAMEKCFIREVVDDGRPVLGICLGAQLVASAMGSRVKPNRVKEIGWFPIQGVPADAAAVFRFPPAIDVFHWHGETFDLPTGAVRLARSAACENQAFQLGWMVVGLQFHLETTPGSAREIVDNCRDELVEAEYVQSASAILAAPFEKYLAANAQMAELLSSLTGRGGRT